MGGIGAGLVSRRGGVRGTRFGATGKVVWFRCAGLLVREVWPGRTEGIFDARV